MTRVLILLTLPQEVTAQYCDSLRAAFPDMAVDVARHHREAEAVIGPAQVLIIFGPMLTDAVDRAGSSATCGVFWRATFEE
jgi:hypothetical protein